MRENFEASIPQAASFNDIHSVATSDAYHSHIEGTQGISMLSPLRFKALEDAMALPQEDRDLDRSAQSLARSISKGNSWSFPCCLVL